MKLMGSNGWYLTEKDSHYQFWKHLQSGGKVWRNDRLNDEMEVLKASSFEDCTEVTRFGYKDLSIIPKDLEMFYYDFLDGVN